MRWYEKMNKGMALMKEACAENDSWQKCWSCPFDSICEKLQDIARAEMISPDSTTEINDYIPCNWQVKEEEE